MNQDVQTQMLIAATTETAKLPVQIIYNSWIKPKFEKFFARRKLENQLSEYTSDLFYEYLNRSYEQNKSISILAIGNQQVQIEDVYQPLTISRGNFNEEEKYLIQGFPLEMANKYKKVLIEDQAGMGKSTLMKRMFVSAIEQNIGIPVFIELRKLVSKISIIDFILESVSSVDEEYNKELLLELIKRGDFIFFFDGYDEIPFNIKEEVTINLKKFISKADKNIYFLTSRPDNSLASFGNFVTFEIMKLRPEEAYKLFEKYDKKTNFNISSLLTNQIVESLDSGSFRDLESFLGSPLLVSFIYITYKHKRNIPSNKDDFYRKVYDALFEDHDYSKDGFKRGKYCNLSKENFHKFLRKLGFICLLDNKNDYSKDKLIKLIEEAKNISYVGKLDSSDIFNDLLETVPIFAKEGLSYRWAHKSFMEYFSACYIFMDKASQKEEVLKQIFASEYFDIYENLLDIYYDIDQETFDRVLVLPILNEYLVYMGDMKKTRSLTKQNLKSYLFNRIFYLSDKMDFKNLLDEDVIIQDVEKKILDLHYKNEIEKIYKLSIIFQFINFKESKNDVVCQGIFSPNPNIIKILYILVKKESVFLNNVDQRFNDKKNPKILSYLDDVDSFTEKSVKSNFDFILGMSFSGDRFYINYEEAKKYKKSIDQHNIKRQKDTIIIL